MKTTKLIPWNWFGREGSTSNSARGARHGAHMTPEVPLYFELDRLFDDLFHGYFPRSVMTRDASQAGEAVIRPNLDISGDDKQYFVTVELPGVDEKDLHVELENDILRISGEKRYAREIKPEGGDVKEDNGTNYYRLERSYGSFQRMLTMPDDVDVSGIKASHKDGVLTITLPRKEQVLQTNKRIAVTKE